MSLPRILTGAGPSRMSYTDHLRHHGELPAVALTDGSGRRGSAGRGDDGTAPPLLLELARSGLRGRGGGGFPLASKIESVRRTRRKPPVMVVNGTEGEPMSVKDRMLLESLPHLVIDGALCCARLAGAERIVFTLDASFRTAAESLETALHERPELGRELGDPTIVTVPDGYVTGQETAVVNFINTGRALPTTQIPRITERGVDKRPTLMSNAETLAHAALIARRGAGWFRQLGTDEEPGSVLVTLSGAVRRPGVYEVEYGSLLTVLLDAAGGQTEPLRAFLMGGYAGGWLTVENATGARLSDAFLRPLSASLGAGIIVALPRTACPVAEVTRVVDWMADQSAGQCGPCVNGLAAIADTMAALCGGSARRDALSDIRRWSALVTGRGACAHPDGVARFVTSALAAFASDIEDHAANGLCDACERRPVLVTPRARDTVR